MKKLVILLPILLSSACSSLLYPHGGLLGPRPIPYYGRAQHAPAPPVGRWDSVMRLPYGSTIDVLTNDGLPNVGPITFADAKTVVISVTGREVRIPRSDVIRIDLVDLAGNDAAAVAKRAGRGALLGAGAAVLVGAVLGGSAWPPPGQLVRGGIAIGAVAGGEAALMARQRRMIYLAREY